MPSFKEAAEQQEQVGTSDGAETEGSEVYVAGSYLKSRALRKELLLPGFVFKHIFLVIVGVEWHGIFEHDFFFVWRTWSKKWNDLDAQQRSPSILFLGTMMVFPFFFQLSFVVFHFFGDSQLENPSKNEQTWNLR